MAVFKCKMCGGTLNIVDKMTVCECEYCGTRQTLPKLDDEKRLNLYERANHFRRNNEFDKAMGIYEMILGEDNTDSEAYWSIVLCRYGIEYVDDPSTHKKVPTVNRAQTASVFNDSDYMKAIENADGYQKEVYEAEAKAIEKIQKGILEISSKEEPFDVFICYKETDPQGRRTHDSVYAQDIYNSLVKEGYRVFFSRITLENKIGTAYEPYIFAALNSAKVMLVIGTSAENMNAVWVKNEWSRYLSIIRADSSKALIPCYKDMSPYDMPEEFAYLQSQDMGKIGYMQDLLHGIQKVVSAGSTVKETVVINSANPSVDPLLKRAFIFLEDGDWESADEYCEKVLDINPECAEAYLGKLMADLEIKKRDKLSDLEKPFNDNIYCQKVLKYGDAELNAEISEYIEHIEATIENNRKDSILNKAKAKMDSDFDFDYEDAIRLLESIPGWKDANEEIERCKRIIADFETEEKYRRLERERMIKIARIEREKRIKRNKKITAVAVPIVCAVIAFIIVLITVIIPKNAYKKIKDSSATLHDFENVQNNIVCSFTQNDYEEATTVFINNYEQRLVNENKYTELLSFVAKYDALCQGSFKVAEDKYEAYYNAVINYKHSDGYSYLYNVNTGLGIQCAMLKKLPDGYKNSKDYIKASSLFGNIKKNTSYYDYNWIEENQDALIKNFDNTVIKNIIINSDYLEQFMLGYWSGDGYYLKFYKNDDDSNGTTYYQSNLSHPSFTHDHYSIRGDKMIFTRENDSTTADVFKFDFINANKVKVYCYKDGKTYTLTR